MHIVIPDDYQNAVRTLTCFQKLAGHTVQIYTNTVTDIATLAARFHEADALVLIRERTPITAALLDRLPRLKVIAQTGKGAAHLDLDACTQHGVAVMVGTGSPYAPAELTWALIMASMRHLPQEIASLQAGTWQATFGRGLRGRTLGIYGYGKIGAVVAGYGRAFGMNVMIWGREGTRQRAQADGYAVAASPAEFFQQADVLSLHIKLSAETRGLITPADLAQMKPDALLVNTSRADLIAPGALEAALRAGRPGYAAIDVFESEPVFDHPLLHLPNVIATPHLGYVERDSYELYFGTAFDQLLAFAAGDYSAVINPTALKS